MYIKVVWNREDYPEYTMVECGSYIVDRRENTETGQQPKPYVYVNIQCVDPNMKSHSLCLSGRTEVFVMNESGKTIDTIRV